MSAAWRAGAPRTSPRRRPAIEWWYALTHPDPLGDHLRLWFDGTATRRLVVARAAELESARLDRRPGPRRRGLRGDHRRGARRGDGVRSAFAAEDDHASIDVLRCLGFVPEGPAPVAVAAPSGRDAAGDADPAGRLPHPRPARPGRVRGARRGPPRGVPAVAADRREVRAAAQRPALPTRGRSRRRGPGRHRSRRSPWPGDDGVGRVGEFEPVGTHPDHQRRGLSRASSARPRRGFFERGAAVVQVYSDPSEAGPEALYAAVGSERRAIHQRYERRPSAPARRTLRSAHDRWTSSAPRIERDSMGEMACRPMRSTAPRPSEPS